MTQDIADDVETCRVLDINHAGMCSYDPSVETSVLENSLGKVVVQTRSYSRYSDTRAGLLVDIEEAKGDHYSQVYVVQKPQSDQERIALSRALRQECDVKGPVYFF